jgi:hypothetical protein
MHGRPGGAVDCGWPAQALRVWQQIGGEPFPLRSDIHEYRLEPWILHMVGRATESPRGVGARLDLMIQDRAFGLFCHRILLMPP